MEKLLESMVRCVQDWRNGLKNRLGWFYGISEKILKNILNGFCKFLIVFFGVAVLIVGAVSSYILLVQLKALNGAEAVALFSVFSILGLIVCFFSQIQELSIAGNVIRLREIRQEAEDSLSTLKSVSVNLLQIMLHEMCAYQWDTPEPHLAGGKKIWWIIDQIERLGCEDVLRGDLIVTLRYLIKSQCDIFSRVSGGPVDKKMLDADLIRAILCDEAVKNAKVSLELNNASDDELRGKIMESFNHFLRMKKALSRFS